MNRTSLADLADRLDRMQLPRNHVFMVHSSLLRFGLIEGGLPGVMACLRQALGPEATLLMPAFTFAYGRSRQWDYHASKAETGALSEYFRTLPGTGRTLHPFHSLSVAGPRAAEFLACHQRSSFGPGSPFALLHDLGAINIGLGTELEGGATFLHHAEELARVPYRVDKDFPGEVRGADGQPVPQTFSMFVRDIGAEHTWTNRWDHVWQDLLDNGLVRLETLHGAKLFALDIPATHRWFSQRLSADPYYCAVSLPTPP